MHITISTGDDAPIYRQIIRQVREAIAGSRLVAGDRLPSQRQLAQQLVVSPLTVKKAYDELERDGLIRCARGQGTFVSTEAPKSNRAERLESLRAEARKLVHEAHLSDLSLSDLQSLFAEEHKRMELARNSSTRTKSAS